MAKLKENVAPVDTDKYSKLTGQKRKTAEAVEAPAKKAKTNEQGTEAKKSNFSKNGNAPGQRVSKKPDGEAFDKKFGKKNSEKKPFKKFDADVERKPYKKFEDKSERKPFKKFPDSGKKIDMHKYKAGANGKFYSKTDGKPLVTDFKKKETKPEEPKKKKELKKERREKKLGGENFEVQSNMKKIWETLRRADTPDEAKKKLCTSLFDNAKGKIKLMAFAHDTCRVIECLVQYGNERHRTGVFNELKEDLVELSKSKYARFMIKKLLLYCDKDQIEYIIKAFSGKVVKLMKHSFACQVIETVYNEHANHAQRINMQMEFFDPTLAILTDKKHKCLKDVLDAQPENKERILNNLKTILNSCINKTLLMFSLVHKVFVEYFKNCDQKDKLEMIDTLAEHLIHMVHTRDGTEVALCCVWFGGAKERKKIIKSMKTFIHKIAIEEHGHKVLLALFDSVDDTKFVSKGVLEELFRQMKELFNNEYGRKVITYLVAPRDTRFFIKDYVKGLETGDQSDTKKKDPELRKKELLDYTKPVLKEFLNKEIASLLFNGAGGVLIPVALKELGADGNDMITSIAGCLLAERFEVPEEEIKKTESVEGADAKKVHPIEDATVHYICKQIFSGDAEREKSSLNTLGDSLLSHQNSLFIRYWIDCNRGCFTLVQLIESCNDVNKGKLKVILDGAEKKLSTSKASGAKVLLKKLEEVK